MARKKPKVKRPPHVPAYLTFWCGAARWTPAEKYVAMYLWTCPEREQGREGLFRPDVEAMHLALGEQWDNERIERALVGLQKHEWLVIEAGWVFLTGALDWDQPWGQRSVAAAVARLELAPRHLHIWRVFLDKAEAHAPELHRALLPGGIPGVFATAEFAPTVDPNAKNALPQRVDPKSSTTTGDSDLQVAHDSAVPAGLTNACRDARDTASADLRVVNGDVLQFPLGEGKPNPVTTEPSGSDQHHPRSRTTDHDYRGGAA